MVRLLRSLSLAASLALVAGALACPGAASTGDDDTDAGFDPLDAGPTDTGFPLPDDDLVAPIGSAGTFDVAGWNIENFPATGDTPALVADLITSLDLDLIGVAEIADEDAFNELVQRLPDHEAVLSTHEYQPGEYQKVGFIYRSSLLTLEDSSLLFPGSGGAFPRPPLEAFFRVDPDGDDDRAVPFDLVAIVVHFKAGRANDDFDRRREAFVALEGYVAAQSDPVVIVGDFNEVLDDARARANWAPFLTADYDVHTQPLSDSEQASFLPSRALLDHIVSNAALRPIIGGADAVIPRIDATVERYQTRVSDHLPVILPMDAP